VGASSGCSSGSGGRSSSTRCGLSPVVMVDVDAERPLEVAAVEDQQPVKTLGAHGPDEALGDRVRLRDRTGVFTIRMPSLRKTSSKRPLYLLSRSRIRKRTPRSERSRPRRNSATRSIARVWGAVSGVGSQFSPRIRTFPCCEQRVSDMPQAWRFFVAWMCGKRSSDRGAISWPCPS